MPRIVVNLDKQVYRCATAPRVAALYQLTRVWGRRSTRRVVFDVQRLLPAGVGIGSAMSRTGHVALIALVVSLTRPGTVAIHAMTGNQGRRRSPARPGDSTSSPPRGGGAVGAISTRDIRPTPQGARPDAVRACGGRDLCAAAAECGGPAGGGVLPPSLQHSQQLGFDLRGDVAVGLDQPISQVVAQTFGLRDLGDAVGDQPRLVPQPMKRQPRTHRNEPAAGVTIDGRA